MSRPFRHSGMTNFRRELNAAWRFGKTDYAHLRVIFRADVMAEPPSGGDRPSNSRIRLMSALIDDLAEGGVGPAQAREHLRELVYVARRELNHRAGRVREYMREERAVAKPEEDEDAVGN